MNRSYSSEFGLTSGKHKPHLLIPFCQHQAGLGVLACDHPENFVEFVLVSVSAC